MMRLDRHAAVLAVGVPVLLFVLGMLARTELVLGDAVRRAVAAQARRVGADVEILTVRPAGLYSVELERVSARVPRGDFAVELDVASVIVTPRLSSLWGEVQIAEIEVDGGVAVLVPWREERAPHRPPPVRRPSDAGPRAASPPAAPAIEVSLRNVQIAALNDTYRTQPLELTSAQFTWQRGKPVQRLAGYGQLPDAVPFAIVAADGVYRLRPQRRTQIDQWVAPRVGGVGWPVSLRVRDIRLCPGCESVVAFEDLELGVPAWRDDVRILVPLADVARRGPRVELGATEIAVVDATNRELPARVTQSAFRYAVDTGHLDGRLELAAVDGGELQWRWQWDAEDFEVDLVARQFPLAGVWHLSPVREHLRPGRIDGEASLAWDMQHRTLGLEADLTLDRLFVRVPQTGEEVDFVDGRFEVAAYFDGRGRAVSVPRAALTLGAARPIEASLQVVDALDGYAFDAALAVEQQGVQGLIAALPGQWTDALQGAELEGEFGLRLRAAGHSAYPESLVLEGDLLGEVAVRGEGRADVRRVGTAGAPPMRAFPDWTPFSAIGQPIADVVLAAEDAGFLRHDGFDWVGIQRAMVHNLAVRRLERGGSTISQQVAKNLFLDGKRTVARKLQEAYLTWRLESVLPKRRILEIYLNIAEWGRGVRGLGAAARHYFDATPRELAVVEAALLGAILPNPHRFGGWIDQGWVAWSRLSKVERILRNLRFLGHLSAESYQAMWTAARRGEVGRLTLKPCDDGGRPELPRCP